VAAKVREDSGMLPLVLNRTDRPLRLLCLGAHSDDIEIGCGGAVLRLLAERPGTEVHWVVFSAGDAREQEARASAAEFLGAAGATTVTVKQFRDSYFPSVWADIKDAFVEIRRHMDPDVVFCHRVHDLHQDHRVVAELAWNTFRNHLILEYEIPKYEGDLGTPNVFVSLSTAHADRKVELLMKHFASQRSRGWFRPSTFQGIMSIRGIECNAPEGWAEAFHARKVVI
jgi:LmbE family N-acetylglucosaminyl deacetylase